MAQTYPKTQWRLLITPQPHPGAWNMAVDEAVFDAIENGTAPPTMRLYAWEPVCLSLGQLQPIADVDLGALSRKGWHIVRRLTGGRAILHHREITYSIIGPRNDPRLCGRVLDSYQRIAGGLLRALELLSLIVSISAEQTSKEKPTSAVCFETPSLYEITAGGRKIFGSAQARRMNALLQHGSLPLYGDLTDITLVLNFGSEEERLVSASQICGRAATLAEALGQVISWEEAAKAMIRGFEQALNLELLPGDLSPQEAAAAERLCAEKYASSAWTHRF